MKSILRNILWNQHSESSFIALKRNKGFNRKVYLVIEQVR